MTLMKNKQAESKILEMEIQDFAEKNAVLPELEFLLRE